MADITDNSVIESTGKHATPEVMCRDSYSFLLRMLAPVERSLVLVDPPCEPYDLYMVPWKCLAARGHVFVGFLVCCGLARARSGATDRSIVCLQVMLSCSFWVVTVHNFACTFNETVSSQCTHKLIRTLGCAYRRRSCCFWYFLEGHGVSTLQLMLADLILFQHGGKTLERHIAAL